MLNTNSYTYIVWIYTKVNPEGAAAMNPLAPAAPAAAEAAPVLAPAADPQSRQSLNGPSR